MKYDVGDYLFLTDIEKGDHVRYCVIVETCGDFYWGILINSGLKKVAIYEDEIIKKISKEEYELAKILLS